MRIVLSGYYGFDNVGDDAILLSIIQALKKWQDNVEITVLSNNPAATEQTYGVRAVNRWQLREIREAIQQADGVISGGGSLMQDQTGMKSIPYYAGIIRIAKWYRKPVFVYAQGMGPINKGLSKLIVKSTFNKVERITVRDESSKALLEDIGVRKPVTVVPDPVIGLDSSTLHSAWLDNQAFNASYIAVSVRDWPTDVAYKEKIAESLDLLARQGEKIVFVPMHGEHDAKTSEEVAAMMKETSTIAPYELSIEEKITVIGRAKLLIGMRLHSLIFSSIYYTPFIAISYDPKIDAFANIMQQPIIGHVEIDDWDGHQLFEKATQVLDRREFVESDLIHKVQAMRDEAVSTAKMALDVFTNKK